MSDDFADPVLGVLRLGATPPLDDPRTIPLRAILMDDLLPAPDRVDNSQLVVPWGMAKNDLYGDCVVAAYVHLLMLVAAKLGGAWSVSETEIVRFYFERTGGVDSGLVILTFLKWCFANFWVGKKILAFASVKANDFEMMAQAIYLTGSIFRGVGLPRTAQSQVGSLWDWVDVAGNGRGSWGWHCVLGTAYDRPAQRTKEITWGMVQLTTYRWLAAYQTEAYVIITEDTPGIDRNRLATLLKAISDGNFWGPPPVPEPLPPPVAVTISPRSATAIVGKRQIFVANVPVTWRAGRGFVISSGLYQAPVTAGSDWVEARSVADPTQSMQAAINVILAPLPPPPPPPPDPVPPNVLKEVMRPDGGGSYIPKLWS